jgi:hypothetical protein
VIQQGHDTGITSLLYQARDLCGGRKSRARCTLHVCEMMRGDRAVDSHISSGI